MRRPAHRSESGTALVWALFFVVVTAAMIVSHTTYLSANRDEMSVRHGERSLASTIARSGLTDALSWFQRQANQPVAAFEPRYDPTGNPPSFDTEDDGVGLVRSFQIRGNLWGRYEVRRGEAADISAQRGRPPSSGEVWDLAARGVLYRVMDPNVPFNQSPNRVLSSTSVGTEIRGIALSPPASAAVVLDDPAKLTMSTNGSIDGNGAAGLASADTGVLLAAPVGTVGTPAASVVAGFDSSPKAVLGMGLSELQQYANYYRDSRITAGADAIRRVTEATKNGGVVMIRGTSIFPPFVPLRFKDVLWVVVGDMHMNSLSDVEIEGVVYVTGDARIEGKNRIDGTLVVRGSLELGGSSTGSVTIRHDGERVQRLKANLARYRARRSQTRR